MKTAYLNAAVVLAALLAAVAALAGQEKSPVGVWSVTGSEKLTVRGRSAEGCFQDSFTFLSDGGFLTIETSTGSWYLQHRNLIMNLNTDEMKTVLNNYLDGTGIEVSTVSFYTMTAKIKSKTGELKGRIKGVLYVSAPSLGIYDKKVVIRGKFSGWRSDKDGQKMLDGVPNPIEAVMQAVADAKRGVKR